jgi:two-component system cell cycle sensor histidine kinase/response regulator CckA
MSGRSKVAGLEAGTGELVRLTGTSAPTGSSDLFALTLEHCPAAVAVLDCSMRYVATSRRWISDFGLESRLPIVGLSHYDVLPDPPPHWIEVHKRCLAGAIERSAGDRFLGPDGRAHWVRWEVRPWHNAGEIGGIVIFAETITEQKRVEQELQRRDESLRLAIAASNLGIWHWNIATGELTWSDLIFSMFGVPQGTAVTYEQFVSTLHAEDRERVTTLIQAAVDGKTDYDTEYRCVWPDGSIHWISAKGRGAYDAQGRPVRMEGVVLDITPRKRLEEELRQAQKMEAIGQLAGGVAHDFNNLLTVILGQVARLEVVPGLPPRARDSIHDINYAAERAASLTAQLLAFGRRQVMNARDLVLDDVAASVTSMLQRMLGEHIVLDFEPSRPAGRVHADPNMLTQVLFNLAINARDAMPRGGRLVIRTSLESCPERTGLEAPGVAQAVRGEFMCLAVSDTGGGIPDHVLPHIFEPFFTTKEVGQGTGLGLATVYGIVKQHGGWIAVESHESAGTTFKIYLPRVSGAAVPEDIRAPALTATGRGELILLVEDEEAVRKVVQLTLEQDGYRLLPVANGREALDVWRAHQGEIDLLLSDCVMPSGISGGELAARLQAEKPGLKTVLCSGYGAANLGEALTSLSHTAFLQKPYRVDQLLSVVRQALDEG